jgi:hypothetical protein
VYGSLIVAASVFIVLFDDVAKSDSFPGAEITGMSRLPERNRCGQEALGFEAGVDGFLTSTIFPPSIKRICQSGTQITSWPALLCLALGPFVAIVACSVTMRNLGQQNDRDGPVTK